MPNYRRADIPGGTYFFTLVSYRRQKILCNENIRIALRDAIVTARVKYPFSIDALVLLPDHLHSIWTLPENDNAYSVRWSMIKRLVTQRVAGDDGAHGAPYGLSSDGGNGVIDVGCAVRTGVDSNAHGSCEVSASRLKRREGNIWQRRFWEHQVRDQDDLNRCMDYLHGNPLKHGHVVRVVDWPYSTFHRFVREGLYPEGWGGGEVDDGSVFGE